MIQILSKILEHILAPLIVLAVAAFYTQKYNFDSEANKLIRDDFDKKINVLTDDLQKISIINNALLTTQSILIKNTNINAGSIQDYHKQATENIVDVIVGSEKVASIEPPPRWKTILNISWLKNTNFFGYNMVINADEYATFSPEKIPFIISLHNLTDIKASINIIDKNGDDVFTSTMKDGDSQVFTYNATKYKFNVVDIRAVGITNSLAMYFSIDINE